MVLNRTNLHVGINWNSLLIALDFFWSFSQFLYDLTRTAGTAPDIATVRLWIRQIGDHLGCVFSYTDRLGKVLVKRANHLKDKMKNLSGVRKFRGEFTFWKMIECKSRNILAVIVVTVVTATAT